MSENRTIIFDNIVNARHLGGIKTVDGKTVKNNVLLRTGNLSRATEADVLKLKNEYNLKHIFDFRTTSEIGFAPDMEVEGANNSWINILGTATPGGDSAKQKDFSVMDEKLIRDTMDTIKSGFLDGKMLLFYKAIALNEVSQAGYAKMFDELLTLEGGTALWHCSQGKDRAGFASVLILSALGADRQTVLDDYEMSNEGYRQIIEISDAICEEEQLDEVKKGVLRAMVGVNRDYMETILNIIDESFGSIDNYLLEAIKLTDESKQKLREYYLE